MKNNKTINKYSKVKLVILITMIVCLPFLIFGNLGIYILAFPTIFPIIGICINIYNSLVKSPKDTNNISKKIEESAVTNKKTNKYNIKKFLIVIFFVIAIAIVIYLIVIFLNNQRKINNKLNGYYYEKINKYDTKRVIYYFEEDSTCFIKHQTINNKLSNIVISESYTHCTYKIENNSVRIEEYDNNTYNNMSSSKLYTLENTENGILLNGIEFLTQNYENIDTFRENVLEQYSFKCATEIAEKYNMYKYCTTWKKISDGFYNYSCGIDIRTYIDDIGISYDTYSRTSGVFTRKDYCYKIIEEIDNPIEVSDEITTKSVPIKIVLTGKLQDEYMIEAIDKNYSELSIKGYKYRLNGINDYPIYIDVNNLKENKEYRIKLKKPVYLKEINLDEILININVKKKEKKDFIVNGNNIITRGVKENLYVSSVNHINEIKVSLFGTYNNLKRIGDVGVYVDLEEYTLPGIYDVELKLNLDETIYDYNIEPSTIKIKIN